MLEVSEKALEKLEEMLSTQGRSEAAIRIAVMGGGANSLGLVVDDVRETDVLIDTYKTPLVIDSNLMNWCKTINIDFITGSSGGCDGSSGSGFTITPGQPINL